jgi:hypothetical protein
MRDDLPLQGVHDVLIRRGLPGGRFIRLWGGMGSKCQCEACGRIIGPTEIEFESEFRRGAESLTLHLHRQCWESWGLDGDTS